MLIQDAIDEFLLYLEVEKNCSDNTISGYEYDLNSFVSFLQSHNRSLYLLVSSKKNLASSLLILWNIYRID